MGVYERNVINGGPRFIASTQMKDRIEVFFWHQFLKTFGIPPLDLACRLQSRQIQARLPRILL